MGGRGMEGTVGEGRVREKENIIRYVGTREWREAAKEGSM